jgi:hypothetical protein
MLPSTGVYHASIITYGYLAQQLRVLCDMKPPTAMRDNIVCLFRPRLHGSGVQAQPHSSKLLLRWLAAVYHCRILQVGIKGLGKGEGGRGRGGRVMTLTQIHEHLVRSHHHLFALLYMQYPAHYAAF